MTNGEVKDMPDNEAEPAPIGEVIEPLPEQRPTVAIPAAPSSLSETGISKALITALVTKALYVSGELTEVSTGQLLKLPFVLVKGILDDLRREKLCEIKGPADSTALLFRYALTGAGI